MSGFKEVQQRAAASQTLFDRVVGYFSPSQGLARLQNRMLLDAATGSGGYNGGRRDRRALKRWRPPEASADADILPDLPDLRGRSRDLARNTPLATGAIATDVTHVIGDGLVLQASIDHEALGISAESADQMEREQEREFALFCRTCDFTRIQKFDELQSLVYRAKRESGDVFVFRRFRKDAGDVYGTKLLVIEADRVSNPDRRADSETVAGGVEFLNGVPVAYHVTDKHPGGIRPGGLAWDRIAARTETGLATVLHLYDRLRPEQSRGIPYLAVVIEPLKQLGTYSDAEIAAAVVSSFVTVAIESPDDDGEQAVIGERDQGLADNEVKLGSGAVLSLAPGEKMSAFNPGRPNDKFDPFFLAITRQIGVALEIPHELLIKHFTASYTASRAALELAKMTFKRRRSAQGASFNDGVYEWFMDEAVASGRLNRPGYFENPLMRAAYLGAEWIGPAMASLNPKQEAEADARDIETGVKTREQVCIERTGGEFEKKAAQLSKEARMLRDAGLTRSQPEASAAPQRAKDDPAEDDTDAEAEDEE